MKRKLYNILALVLCLNIGIFSSSCASAGIRNAEKIKEVLPTADSYQIVEIGKFPQSSSNSGYIVEPLKWRVLENDGETMLLVCDSVIAGLRYDGNSNDYANSEVRQWLINDFYATAFSSDEKERIISVEVDNSASSTGYDGNKFACENTNDKIFLLSHQQATNSRYFATESSRKMAITDYAKAMGVTAQFGKCLWWLRSPSANYLGYSCLVKPNGEIGSYFIYTCGGVVPAMRVKV